MPDVRWLDASEQRTWRAFMVATRLVFEQFEHDLQRGAEMPAAYYEVLVRLSEAPERSLRMSDLANRSQSSRSRLSHAIARLEEAGWIRREICPTDRRGAFAVLTDEGFAALAAAAPVHVESVRRHLFDQLEVDDLDDLRRISEKLLAHLAVVNEVSVEELLGDVGCASPGASVPPHSTRPEIGS